VDLEIRKECWHSGMDSMEAMGPWARRVSSLSR